MHGVHHPDRKRRFQHCDSHVSECDSTWNKPDTKLLCHGTYPLSFTTNWRLIKGLEATHTLRCWHPRCACRIRSNKDAVRRHTTFIVAHPVAATCFGCIIRPYVSENANRKLHRAVRLSFYIFLIRTACWWLLDVAETCSCYWICHTKRCRKTASLLLRTHTCLACFFQCLGILNIHLKTGYNA